MAALAPGPKATDSSAATVAAVVVTRNRRELLAECLEAVMGQTRRPDSVLVVDNASADGTVEAVHERFAEVDLLSLAENRGGAGGFHAGMKAAYEGGCDWLWLMDDDTIPQADSLERLLVPMNRLEGLPEPLILASKVVWSDGSLHPKNLPWVRVDEGWNELFVSAAAHALVLIRTASFVSILIHRRAIEQHGLPHRHYFVWGDDGEYTARLLKHDAGYMVPASIVHHKTPDKVSVHRQGSQQYYFEIRNKLFQLRGDSWFGREKVQLTLSMLMGLRQFLVDERFSLRSLGLLARAVRDGLRQPAQ